MKYHNRITEIDGIKFDSKREAAYYSDLCLLKRAGQIKDFELQPVYLLQPGFKKLGISFRPIVYIADFKVIHNDGNVEIIDVKGHQTEVFKLKRRLFEYKYPDLSLKLVK